MPARASKLAETTSRYPRLNRLLCSSSCVFYSGGPCSRAAPPHLLLVRTRRVTHHPETRHEAGDWPETKHYPIRPWGPVGGGFLDLRASPAFDATSVASGTRGESLRRRRAQREGVTCLPVVRYFGTAEFCSPCLPTTRTRRSALRKTLVEKPGPKMRTNHGDACRPSRSGRHRSPGRA